MLWQKEETGIYVNIFVDNFPGSMKTSYNVARSRGFNKPKPKCDETAIEHRKIGNKLFKEQNWLLAIERYNESLSFAEIGSDTVGLAYANRAACFRRLHMYYKCLVDIELTKRANYPERLMEKLKEREAECWDVMKRERKNVELCPKLSCEPHKKIPCMSNVLEIERNDEFGRHIKAKSDITVGQVVLVEEAFITTHRHEKYKRCDTCLALYVNTVPCERCTSAMFCFALCENKSFHKKECGVQTVPPDRMNSYHIHVIRSIWRAIKAIPNANELMAFVEEAMANDPMEIPETMSDERSKYRAFLKLTFDRNVLFQPTFPTQIYFIYQALMGNESIRQKFAKKKRKRFLMHLIAQHMCVIQCNTGGLVHNPQMKKATFTMLELQTIVTNYISHSCAPNVTILPYDAYNVVIAVRPIKKGDQLLVSYFRNEPSSLETAMRQKYLNEVYQFQCKCERCQPKCDQRELTVAADVMTSDENFKFIKNNEHSLDVECDHCKSLNANSLMSECANFLSKYGKKAWTGEMEYIVNCYVRVLSILLKVSSND